MWPLAHQAPAIAFRCDGPFTVQPTINLDAGSADGGEPAIGVEGCRPAVPQGNLFDCPIRTDLHMRTIAGGNNAVTIREC
jgi:hypothetical protein